MNKSKDPIVLFGEKHKKFRVQFWEYFTISNLKTFAEICKNGGFGNIESFIGEGPTRNGGFYSFTWEKHKKLNLQKRKEACMPGFIILKGSLDYFTINRIRNFKLFHMHGLYKKGISKEWKYEE